MDDCRRSVAVVTWLRAAAGQPRSGCASRLGGASQGRARLAAPCRQRRDAAPGQPTRPRAYITAVTTVEATRPLAHMHSLEGARAAIKNFKPFTTLFSCALPFRPNRPPSQQLRFSITARLSLFCFYRLSARGVRSLNQPGCVPFFRWRKISLPGIRAPAPGSFFTYSPSSATVTVPIVFPAIVVLR